MRIEARNLKPYAEPVTAGELREGAIYFSVQFLDDEMLCPAVEPVVFIGKDLEVGDSGHLYFQDVASHRVGARYGVANDDDVAVFQRQPETQISHIFEYERALDVLLRCALRRRENR